MPFRLLFYATWDPTRIYKANMDGSDITEIVTRDLLYVQSIAINYDKKRLCWADRSKCCTSLSLKYWVRQSILAIMSLK